MPEECTNIQVINLAAAKGVTLIHEDISVSHILPCRARECKPKIVKFVRRDTKINMIKNKQTLRNNPNQCGVYVNDDLTQLTECT